MAIISAAARALDIVHFCFSSFFFFFYLVFCNIVAFAVMLKVVHFYVIYFACFKRINYGDRNSSATANYLSL